jgi:hypothetical protein
MTHRNGFRRSEAVASAVVVLGVCLGAVAMVRCTTPPVGWEGAGRLQTLPEPQPDSGGAPADAGSDADGAMGVPDSAVLDAGSDGG